jgi:GPH family glycoside/pentoside/hexuronide:cation symporter
LRLNASARLTLFGAGDLAFNLFWQSAMLFLLFYYTEALGIPIGIAATIVMIGSVWDGVANFVAGLMVDRRGSAGGYGRLLVVGAVPLSVSFVLAFLPPLSSGWLGLTGVLLCHLLFRTAYAAVNVPYLAMSARISRDPQDRAFVAGVRMLFGTLAAVTVAVGTVPLGNWLTGGQGAVQTYVTSAVLFSVIATAILVIVGMRYREPDLLSAHEPVQVRAALTSLLHNRAFVALNLAMMAMIVAITVLGKSVLYYFKYVLKDPEGGQLALASMGIVSAIAVPLWMTLGRFIGLRSLWFLASTVATLMLGAFALVDIPGSGKMQLFLMALQSMIVGLNFVFWAMLPNTIEYGERTTGLHVEGAVFGVAAFLQRIAIGIATAILGWSFDWGGYVANSVQSSGTIDTMRVTATIVPMLFFIASCIAMTINPLGHRHRGNAKT